MRDFLQELQSLPGWEDFIEWYNNGLRQNFKSIYYIDFTNIPEKFQLAALVDWLDTTDYCPIVTPIANKKDFLAGVVNRNNGEQIEIKDKNHKYILFPNRPEATMAAALKAMQLLELKEKENGNYNPK